MGIGRLDGNRFNLILSVRHDASSARLDQWRQSFQRASELLYDATDGQHQLGDLYVCNDSSGGRNADAWLLRENGRSNAGDLSALGTESVHMTLYGDERFKPFVIAHELIHYLYGPADEYSGPTASSGLACIGGTTSDACIMEGWWQVGDRFGTNATGGTLVEGRFSELCVSSNHDPDEDTWQDDIYNKSCWETMDDTFSGLVVPSGTPEGPEPAGADTINWIELVPEERFVLVVDRSGSMTGGKLEEAKYGADWWADQALEDELLGVVSYATTASSPADYPLQPITSDSDRNAAQTAIAGLSAGGRTAIGDGLRNALNEVLGIETSTPRDRASTQVVVLLTDGIHNEGEDPVTVLPDLVDNGIRVYTIGIGPDINATLLQDIATTTGGTFYRIDPSLSQTDQEFQIRTRLQEISGIAREGGGVVTTFPERVGSEGFSEAEVDRTVLIEEGSELATFLLTWKRPSERLSLEVESPSGDVYGEGISEPGVQEMGGRKPWHGFHVREPEPGEWTLRTVADGIDEPVDTQTFVFSRNRSLDGGLFGQRRYNRGDLLQVGSQIYHDAPLTGYEINARVRMPELPDDPLPIEFIHQEDDGQARCDVGVANAVFEMSRSVGFYTVEADVWSDGDAHHVTSGELLVDGEEYERVDVPPFQRQYTATIQVGEEQRTEIEIEDPRGSRGQRLQIDVRGTNTHFYPDGTWVSLGSGVSVEEIDVHDAGSLTATVSIHPTAELGYRTVVVSTPRYREVLELEGGFEVDDERTISTDFKGRIDRLRFGMDGRLSAVVLSAHQRAIEVPSEWEDQLVRAKGRQDEIELLTDDDSGSVWGFEVL